jgi:hypothetical protein
MLLVKNIKLGKINQKKIIIYFIFFFYFFFNSYLVADNKSQDTHFVEIKILDKVSSKTSKLNLKINEEKQYENLFIKILKCRNSEFDDNPEVTAYLQVTDITMKDNDKVFIFNGWTFSSSPSIRPFDHPVYDIWLLKCF